MPSAIGLNAHDTLKLGLRPPTPGKVRLKLGDYLTGKLPAIPSDADHLTGLSFGLYGNSVDGVCGPTGLANFIRMVTAKLTGTMVKPTLEAVHTLYRQSGNPNFRPGTGIDDNGVIMQKMLEAAAKHGLGGHKILGFAQVDVSNLDEMDVATALFGGTLVGVALDQAQQAQTDAGTWDYVPGSPDWGGHCVMDGSYFANGGHRVITWAKAVLMTDAFIRNQQFEAWVVILPEHLGSKQFLEGVDVHSLASDFEALTGRPFPVPIPPSPAPPVPPVVPPTPRPNMNFTGYAQIPLLGKAPIVLTQTSSAEPVGFSWPKLDVLALLQKYGQKVLPIVIAGVLAKKAWKDILNDVLSALATDLIT